MASSSKKTVELATSKLLNHKTFSFDWLIKDFNPFQNIEIKSPIFSDESQIKNKWQLLIKCVRNGEKAGLSLKVSMSHMGFGVEGISDSTKIRTRTYLRLKDLNDQLGTKIERCDSIDFDYKQTYEWNPFVDVSHFKVMRKGKACPRLKVTFRISILEDNLHVSGDHEVTKGSNIIGDAEKLHKTQFESKGNESSSFKKFLNNFFPKTQK